LALQSKSLSVFADINFFLPEQLAKTLFQLPSPANHKTPPPKLGIPLFLLTLGPPFPCPPRHLPNPPPTLPPTECQLNEHPIQNVHPCSSNQSQFWFLVHIPLFCLFGRVPPTTCCVIHFMQNNTPTNPPLFLPFSPPPPP